MAEGITELLRGELFLHGADMVGIGDLTELPPEVREGLPVGVCVAVKYPREVIRGIGELPTEEYHNQYNYINKRLDILAKVGAAILGAHGYGAVAQTRAYVDETKLSLAGGENDPSALLPHKTVATRAGLGWIGKCAMLVTKEFGSMIRISSILTDAPLKTAKPVNRSKCGKCTECATHCPARAVTGKSWSVGVKREEIFDDAACERTARERSLKGFGKDVTLCGKCIEVCPYTKMYLDAHDQM